MYINPAAAPTHATSHCNEKPEIYERLLICGKSTTRCFVNMPQPPRPPHPTHPSLNSAPQTHPMVAVFECRRAVAPPPPPSGPPSPPPVLPPAVSDFGTPFCPPSAPSPSLSGGAWIFKCTFCGRGGALQHHFRRGNTFTAFNAFDLEAKAKLWPWLSYMCHIRSTAALHRA